MAINEQAVIDTAERLLAETGRIPTVEAVREAVGGGSFSTISPVLREWRKQHQMASAVAGEIPARVREALERSAAGLWGAFREEVEERIVRAREEADERAGEAEMERDQALQEVTRLEKALSEAVETAVREREVLTQELEDRRAALVEARQENATLTERTRQQQDRIESLIADLSRARADIDAMRQQIAEQAARHDRELEQVGDATVTLKAENARLQERAGYVDELRQQFKVLQDQLVVSTNQNQPVAPAKARSRK